MSTVAEPIVEGKRAIVTPAKKEPDQVKVYNASGVQAVKGGQTIETPILEAVITAYSNLSNSPVVGICYLLSVFCAFAEYNTTDGPLEVIKVALEQLVARTDVSVMVKNLAGFLIYILILLIKYKTFFISLALFWLPYFAKPSENNMKISLLMSVWVFLKSKDIFADLLLSQVYFLYTQLRSPKVKFALMIIGVCVFAVGFANINSYVSTSREPGVRIGTASEHILTGVRSDAAVPSTSPTPKPSVVKAGDELMHDAPYPTPDVNSYRRDDLAAAIRDEVVRP